MFKFFFESILIALILFFVWNAFKRIFFSFFYQGMNNNKRNNNSQNKTTKSERKGEKKLKWDAETIEYEEIKDDKKQ